MFHHLPSVGPKQLCALAHLGCTCEAGTFLSPLKPSTMSWTLGLPHKYNFMIWIEMILTIKDFGFSKLEEILALCAFYLFGVVFKIVTVVE